jgi:hypothetical protein
MSTKKGMAIRGFQNAEKVKYDSEAKRAAFNIFALSFVVIDIRLKRVMNII